MVPNKLLFLKSLSKEPKDKITVGNSDIIYNKYNGYNPVKNANKLIIIYEI